MKMVLVTGTRPDIIKMAPIYWQARKRGHEAILVHCAQHYPYHLFEGSYRDMDLPFPPNYIVHSSLVKKVGRHASKIAHVLDKKFPGVGAYSKVESLAGLAGSRPNPADTLAGIIAELNKLFSGKLKDADVVLVHGDTLTCAGAALSAHLNLLAVAHVEAGLRTFSREPFPEQTDTRTADACSDIHFSATKTNEVNLLNEGFSKERVITVGNTVVDAAQWAAKQGEGSREFFEKLGIDFSKPVAYFSCHRRETLLHRERFEAVVEAAIEIGKRGIQVLWSVRPGTVHAFKSYGMLEKLQKAQNVFLASDIPYYTDIMFLVSKCLFVATDSGSMQEETAALRVPCVTLRYVTDRPESVQAGVNLLAPPESAQAIMKSVDFVIRNNSAMRTKKNPYGDGNSSAKIIDALEKFGGKLIEWEHNKK